MSLKILFPDELEELAVALDGISEATAQAAQDGSESLAAFRRGVQVALAAIVKAAGGQSVQQIKPIDRPNQLNQPTLNPCPLKGIYAEQSDDYYCRFYGGHCPMLANHGYNYLNCPGWRTYEAERRQHACFG
ncbi:MAG: hypothetical protein SVX38_16425 [Chloroflexota bacterium]|nr:hypothetical protein [Chloroflexota bacterium]